MRFWDGQLAPAETPQRLFGTLLDHVIQGCADWVKCEISEAVWQVQEVLRSSPRARHKINKAGTLTPRHQLERREMTIYEFHYSENWSRGNSVQTLDMVAANPLLAKQRADLREKSIRLIC
jgi:hypothetical protein